MTTDRRELISPAWLRTGAVVAPLLAAGVLSIWRDSISTATEVLVLVALVVAASATGDRWAGIAAAVSSAIWFDYLLTEPYLSLTINASEDIEAAVLLLLIGTVVTEVALWGRRQQGDASRREGYLDGILTTAELVLLHHDSIETLADEVAERISDVLGIDGCRFVPGPGHGLRAPVLDHDGSVVRSGRTLDVERDGLPIDDETVLVVRRRDQVVGHFLLTSATHVVRPTLEQRRVAVLLADQVAALADAGPG